MLGVSQEVTLARAGAIAQYVNQVRPLCVGSRRGSGEE
jgi:hypothetical protein